MKVPATLSSLMPDVTQMVFNNLPQTLSYHNINHTKQVVNFALQLAEKAQLTERETNMLYAAAVLHDTGYGKKYTANEGVGAILAAKILPEYGFFKYEIEQIKNMILATNLVIIPQNKLEMLMSDADMGYLGGDDFLTWSNKLFTEWKTMGLYSDSPENWLLSQIDFLSKHEYFTPEAIALFEAGKQKNINQLKSLKKWPF